MDGPTEGTCVEHLHVHVGQCYRRGLLDGYTQGLAAAAAADNDNDE